MRSTSACIEKPPPPPLAKRCPNPELGSHPHHLEPFLVSRHRLCSSLYSVCSNTFRRERLRERLHQHSHKQDYTV